MNKNNREKENNNCFHIEYIALILKKYGFSKDKSLKVQTLLV